MRRHRVSLIAALFVVGWSQACDPFAGTVSQPTEYVGRWARFAGGDSWTDTVELFVNGSTRGQDSAATIEPARWAIVRTRFGSSFCFGSNGKPNCQQFRLEGDTLVLGFMPHVTYWRRAH